VPMLIKVPRNADVLRDTGSYPSGLNLLSRKQTAVQRQVRREGLAGYERETQATLLALAQLSPRPTEFFDVGAHIGLYSALIAAIFRKDVGVTAFEPTPDTAELAQTVARVNRLDIRIEQCALSAKHGKATLYLSEKSESSNSLAADFRPSSRSVTVPVTTLDRYCLRRGKQPTMMKIDVETLEAQVLLGAMKTLSRARPAVICELLPKADPERTKEVLEKLVNLDYCIYHWTVAEGWTECAAGDVRDSVSSTQRDWLFAPHPIDSSFHDAVDRWLEAINECTADTTLLVDAGQQPPPGWNTPYAEDGA
jgi:FkbM family methyltransferase